MIGDAGEHIGGFYGTEFYGDRIHIA